MLCRKSGTTWAVHVCRRRGWMGGPYHVTRGKHRLGLLAARCHMPAHEEASHKLVGHAEPYLWIRQTHNRKNAHRSIGSITSGKTSLDWCSRTSPTLVVASLYQFKSLLDLIKWQQLDAVPAPGQWSCNDKPCPSVLGLWCHQIRPCIIPQPGWDGNVQAGCPVPTQSIHWAAPILSH